MKILGLESYKKMLEDYLIDINDFITLESVINASEEELINWALIDAINYYHDLKYGDHN